MKKKMMEVIFLFSCMSLKGWGGFSDLSQNERYHYKSLPKKKRKKPRGNPKREMDKSLIKLMEQEKKIMELLEKQEKRLILRKGEEKVLALSRFRGVLLNSVLAMNVKKAKFIVQVLEGELEGGELRCTGHDFERRVISRCNLLVLREVEYPVDVELWGLDGAEGIRADDYYSGEEKDFLTSSFAAFFQGVFDMAKDTKDNIKKRIWGGTEEIAESIREKIISSGEKKVTIAYVNSGKKVLIFFNKTVLLKKRGER